MVKKLNVILITVILVSLTGGYLIDKYCSDFNLKEIKYSFINANNQIENKIITSVSKKFPLLDTFSKFLYSLSVSLFIGVFITNQIERNRKKEHENELKTIQANINSTLLE